jgi:hypothetical protein
LACGWLEPLPSLQRGIKSDYLFRDRSVRPLLLPGPRRTAALRASAPQLACFEGSEEIAEGAGLGKRERPPQGVANVACGLFRIDRRPPRGAIGRSCSVHYPKGPAIASKTLEASARFPNSASRSVPSGSGLAQFSIQDRGFREVLLEAPKGVSEAAHKTFGPAPLAGSKRLRHSARALKHSAGA